MKHLILILTSMLILQFNSTVTQYRIAKIVIENTTLNNYYKCVYK